MPLADEGKDTAAGRALAELGVKHAAVLDALQSVRGNQRVTSDSPESSYEALQKYGMDLVDLARCGKLDPVIGRDAEIRGVIRILSRSANAVEVDVTDLPGPRLLTFVDPHYPGWEASVDGRAQPILRTDLGFRALELTGGDHEVVMAFVQGCGFCSLLCNADFVKVDGL